MDDISWRVSMKALSVAGTLVDHHHELGAGVGSGIGVLDVVPAEDLEADVGLGAPGEGVDVVEEDGAAAQGRGAGRVVAVLVAEGAR